MTVRPVAIEVALELAKAPLPPEAVAFLAALSSGEISVNEGFRTENGGATWDGSLDTLPNWGSTKSSAIGAWQDLKGTWGDVVAANPGITFQPQDQIRGNWWLAQRDYKTRSGGGDLLAALKAGDLDGISTALLATWPGGARSPDFQDTYRALIAVPTPPVIVAPSITMGPGDKPRFVALVGFDRNGVHEPLPMGGALTIDDATVCSATINPDGQGVTVTELASGATLIRFSLLVGGVTLTADLQVIVMTLARIAFDPLVPSPALTG